MPVWEDEPDASVITEQQQQLKKPPLYKVLLHNDHYTTMDFVVFILQNVFHKSATDAYRIMLAVHQQGLGVAGVYPHDIAETKMERATRLAREHEFPLLCTLEEE
jgi:ATP-dependent Clp protease adaptor protein ClpS